MNKKWYKSKTMWVNLIAAAVIVVQGVTKMDIIPVEIQAMILSLLNLALRSVTKENITL